VFFSKADPEKFVQYGEYEMRLRDKRQVEAGLTTQAIIRLTGGELAGARIWKENSEDEGYNVSWDDPRIAKEQREKEQQSQDNRIMQNEASVNDRAEPVPNANAEGTLAFSAGEASCEVGNTIRRPPVVNRTPPTVNRTSPAVDRTPPPPRTVPQKHSVPPHNTPSKGLKPKR
jgi:hypothetical protein